MWMVRWGGVGVGGRGASEMSGMYPQRGKVKRFVSCIACCAFLRGRRGKARVCEAKTRLPPAGQRDTSKNTNKNNEMKCSRRTARL